MIAPGTVIQGTLRVCGDLRMAGSVRGQINADGKVVIAPEGRLEGDLEASCADVAGFVQGAIRAERVVLRATARVAGQVLMQRLVIEEGAQFEGECHRLEVHVVDGAESSPELA
ncbi:MAG: polymer-forming cytoskeletal protein [Bacteroidetes bacterium]|nr:polymer-forming cytoskeletal protein [Rhodothermia bacterium]MCS7154401.1 polymer-forming cytoskeletal protein [Bacteroidota bacterium]MCX7907646.1 polymer-forming cytoskeletal protein [Bacteroidota bacterium]MDW8137775.1 polymer-forming cytoskeletal protein [Bacteroidota bacterium]MDW8286374.1 polymer-forming cytoskeletal protein [Bacteroidota bacterium]